MDSLSSITRAWAKAGGTSCPPRREQGRGRKERHPRIRPRQLPLVFFLVMLVGLGACAGNREEVRRQAEASYKLGIAFLAEGRPAPALRELTKAERLDPENPEVQNALGLAYWARREVGLAEQKFKRAVELKPDYSEAWNNLGALYLDVGRYLEAVQALERALDNVFYTTQERALTNLGWALFKLGRVQEAERRLREAVEMAPGFPLAHKNLGILFYQTGRYEPALRALDRAAAGLPEDAEVFLYRGLVRLRTGDRAGARADLERAWRLAPGGETGRSAKNYLDLLE